MDPTPPVTISGQIIAEFDDDAQAYPLGDPEFVSVPGSSSQNGASPVEPGAILQIKDVEKK